MEALRSTALALFLALATTQLSQGASIAYSAFSGNVNYGLLPDPTEGGTARIFMTNVFPNSPDPVTTFSQQNFNYPSFKFYINYFPSGAPSNYGTFSDGGQIALDVTANIKGSLTTSPNVPSFDQIYAGFTATITSVTLDPGANPADVPEPLLALINNPGRIKLDSPYESFQPGGLPDAYLTFEPQPTPEPTTLTLLMAVLGGAALRYRLNRRRTAP